MEKVKIFDTTLRDGEQSPGASMTTEQKMEIAGQLVKLGVDVIEAGFPVSSPADFESVQRIGREFGNQVTICALSRAVSGDIRVAAEALQGVKNSRIHTGIGVSESHLKDKLKISRAEAIRRAVEAVKLAKSLVGEVEFYAEDAGRADPTFLYQMCEEVIQAGADVINIPDTTGYTIPEEFGALVRGVFKNVKGADHVIVSVHCHNDLGLATANALAGIAAGAMQVECTINGIGERAGNTALEEVVMALRQRKDILEYEININTKEIIKTSQLVSDSSGIIVQPNKAIVGSNAFKHSSGIHQDGVLKDRSTYEIINPVDVGVAESEIVLTARSGRHALRYRIEKLGYGAVADFEEVYAQFLTIADQKKEITDDDLSMIVSK